MAERIIKVLIMGDSGVGKTCVLLRFSENVFPENHVPTIGIDFKTKNVQIGSNAVRVQLWDTAGQERFRTITQSYYKSAMGVILAYDVNKEESFNNVNNWMKQINQHTENNLIKILIGNKIDLGERKVPYEDGKRLADSHNMEFFETSAKTGENVMEAITHISKEICKTHNFSIMSESYRLHYSQITKKTQLDQKKCCK